MNDILKSYEKILEQLPDEYNNLLLILKKSLDKGFDRQINGNLKKWLPVFENLPHYLPSAINFNKSSVTLGDKTDISQEHADSLKETLMNLHPWRKGPFSLFGINIDAEWRSDLKWSRIQEFIAPLKNRNILDIGCGNGYYMFRMLAEGAKTVIGIDPGLLSIIQFKVFQFYLNLYLEKSKKKEIESLGIADVFPVGIEDIPCGIAEFQTVFSMGVLYHRKDPVEHLKKIFSLMDNDAELVLETIILPGDSDDVLHPENRYAQMRNVWNIPSVKKTIQWLEIAGFEDIKVINTAKTSFQEQRSTEWMHFHSLKDFLDENDITKTVEGYPAPHRGVFLAKKK